MGLQAHREGIGFDEWRRMCPSVRPVKVRDNAFVYRQGETCRAIYLIARGHIKLSRLNAQGAEYTMAIVARDDFCGAPLNGEGAPTAADTATSKGAVLLYHAPRAEFVAALSREPRAAAFVVECLAKRQAFLNHRIEQLLRGDVRARIAGILTQLTRSYGGHCTHGHEVDIRLTQQELAEMAGTSRPTVSTILNQWRRQAIVGYTRRYICIDSLRALDSIARAGDVAG